MEIKIEDIYNQIFLFCLYLHHIMEKYGLNVLIQLKLQYLCFKENYCKYLITMNIALKMDGR